MTLPALTGKQSPSTTVARTQVLCTFLRLCRACGNTRPASGRDAVERYFRAGRPRQLFEEQFAPYFLPGFGMNQRIRFYILRVADVRRRVVPAFRNLFACFIAVIFVGGRSACRLPFRLFHELAEKFPELLARVDVLFAPRMFPADDLVEPDFAAARAAREAVGDDLAAVLRRTPGNRVRLHAGAFVLGCPVMYGHRYGDVGAPAAFIVEVASHADVRSAVPCISNRGTGTSDVSAL